MEEVQRISENMQTQSAPAADQEAVEDIQEEAEDMEEEIEVESPVETEANN
jgi:hypothetical protein